MNPGLNHPVEACSWCGPFANGFPVYRIAGLRRDQAGKRALRAEIVRHLTANGFTVSASRRPDRIEGPKIVGVKHCMTCTCNEEGKGGR